MLVDTGLIGFQMGIQTGSPRVSREVFDRELLPEECVSAAVKLHAHRRTIRDRHYHVIVDNPFETESETLQTLDLLSRFPRPFHLSSLSLMYYPGSRLHERAIAEGVLSDKANDVYEREYYAYRRTYLNLLITVSQTLPAGILRFLTSHRRSGPIRMLFYLYYYGYRLPRYRFLNRMILRRIQKRLKDRIPECAKARRELLEATIRFRPQ